MPRDMGWLSPKRRRTTQAVPTVSSRKVQNEEDEEPSSPTPCYVSPKPVLPPPSIAQRPSRTLSSASSTAGPAFSDGEDNLFYAYARRADDLHSRYLLTFASASVANEWWNLIQKHYPDTTRPGPQLFSLKTDDLLSKAWKHSALAHLRPKWMYIQFEEASGSVAQGIIPVQDARGNMLGGASSSSDQSKRETRREIKNEVGVLEERFEKMMEAVERNTEQIAALTETRANGDRRIVNGKADDESGKTTQSGASENAGHLERITQMLEQTSAHVASLAKRQVEHEQEMREMIESQKARENSEQPDMGQLISHLDRIQRVVERSAHGRKDSARDIRTSPPRIDLSPLTFWLEKVLGAVEQNSELIKEMLKDREESKETSPQQVELDISPVSQRLDDLLDAQEARTERDQEANAQMLQRLDKIAETQYKAVERGPFDVSLLSQRLDEILSVHRNAATVPLTEKLDQLIEIQQQPMDISPVAHQLEDLVAETATMRDAIDYAPLKESLEAIRTATEQNGEHLLSLLGTHQTSAQDGRGLQNLDTMVEHLEALRTTAEQNSASMTELLSSLATDQQAVTTSKGALSPFDEEEETSVEPQRDGAGFGGSKFIISALTSHLSKIQKVTDSNANAVRSARESTLALQRSMTGAVSETSGNVRELAASHKDLAAQVAVREGQVREVVRSQAEMVECVRELAKTIKAQDKSNACNHVVIPPPRKTNRKVVGFVYDAKDGRA